MAIAAAQPTIVTIITQPNDPTKEKPSGQQKPFFVAILALPADPINGEPPSRQKPSFIAVPLDSSVAWSIYGRYLFEDKNPQLETASFHKLFLFYAFAKKACRAYNTTMLESIEGMKRSALGLRPTDMKEHQTRYQEAHACLGYSTELMQTIKPLLFQKFKLSSESEVPYFKPLGKNKPKILSNPPTQQALPKGVAPEVGHQAANRLDVKIKSQAHPSQLIRLNEEGINMHIIRGIRD